MLEKFIISSDEEKVGNQNSWCKASNFSGSKIQGVQTLSDKSNLLFLLIQSWSIYNSSGSNLPKNVRNLHTGCKHPMVTFLTLKNNKNGTKGSHRATS